MLKVNRFLFVVAVLKLHIHGVYNEETYGEEYPSYEFAQIFRGVPALFEYLINAVLETPEMLEKNDITKFKRTVSLASYNSDGEENCEEELEGDETPKIIAYEYGNGFLKRDDCKSNDKREVAKMNIKPQKNILKNKIHKDNHENNDKGDKNYENEVWHIEDGYPGIQSDFSLDVKPEEIKDGTLTAEKLLEEYNYKRRS